MKTNIILTGMAGCGKSTVGVLLAKAAGMEFIDTDLILQRRAGKRLQALLDEDGPEAFRRAEEEAVLSIRAEHAVIATGGSVIYSTAAMDHLKQDGICVWLDVPFEEIRRRITNISTRGILLAPGQNLWDVYRERRLLYGARSDRRVDAFCDVEEVVAAVLKCCSDLIP